MDIIEGQNKGKAIIEYDSLSPHLSFELKVMRGNFWRTMGFTVEGGRTHLHAEEALFLFERKRAIVVEAGKIVDLPRFYDLVIRTRIPILCYLVFMKLKMLDYIVVRHNHSVEDLFYFADDRDIYEHMKTRPGVSLLEAMTSFDIYPNSGTFSKKSRTSGGQAGYVIITNGSKMFSTRVLMTLMEEAEGVPLIFAIVTSTTHVTLQEVTDANTSLRGFEFRNKQER